jgi:glycosyltransferase involved in cell wall biosynthesis
MSVASSNESEPGQPLVTVIINCFNGEKYLRQAIDSVMAQTYTNWEIVFWDNQSTDGSATIFKGYADPRLNYQYAPVHTWLYEARNYAIRHAKGELIAFLDVDDWWSPEKLEKQVPLFVDPEVGMACTNFWIANERKNKSWVRYSRPLPSGWVLDDLLSEYFIGMLTLVVRRSALESLDYAFDPRYHVIGDVDFEVRLSVRWKLATVQEPMAFYRLHDSNESVKHRQRLIVEVATWISEIGGQTAIASSPSWSRVINNHTYLQAIHHLLEGNKQLGLATMSALPWGASRLRLILISLLPTSLIRLLKN